MKFAKPALLSVALSVAARGAEPQGAPSALKPYVEGLRLVEMTVEGQTGQFIFDTGAGLSALTPEFARTAGLAPFGRLTGFRHTGAQLQVQRVTARTVSVGGVALSGGELTVFDLTSLLKGAPVVQGLVALNTFDGGRLTIDFAQNRLTLETEQSLAGRIKDMTPLRIRAGRQSGGAALDIFVAVEAAPGPLWLELDSGNAGPVLLSPHAVAQLALQPAGQRTATTLRLSPTLDYPCSVAIKETIFDGLLNTEFFQQHVITLDLHNMQAWARRNAP